DNPDPTASVVVYKIEANGNRIPFKTFTAAFGTAVPPGVYAAEVKVEPPFLFKSFEVPPRRSVTLKVKGKGLIEVRFVKALASVEVLNREDKLVYRLESERPYYIDTGRYKLRVVAPPFFKREIKKYFIYPNGEYRIDLKRDAGVVQFMHPTTQGIYVFASDRILGNYVTNVPFVLPNGTYRLFLDKDCDVRKVQVGDSLNVKNVRCQEGERKKKKRLR
ncbi:MAG: hypothetical protein IT285_12290, partial [Bdellovibrionales bacterium]|nr:hypothetical protein [Bdellovibrionales bacterium]